MTTEALVCAWCPTPTPVRAGRYFCDEHHAEVNARKRRERETEAQENHQAWFDEIGAPRALHAFSFDTIDETRCVQIVRAYRPQVFHGRALVLLGPTGVGKSVAAAALLDSLLPDFQRNMNYVLGLTLVRELHDFDTCDEVMARCTRARLLIIDDLPRRSGDERVEAMLEELLIVREAERRATVVVSNVAPKALTTLLSDRVMDRLKAWGTIQSVVGASLRRAPEVMA